MAAALEIPAFRSYTLPNPDALRISEGDGITRWTQPDTTVHRYGRFWGSSGHLVRKSLDANEWMRSGDGKWTELTRASFTHDASGKSDRIDRFMGTENGSFFLSHGGFVEASTEYGTKFDRPATGKPPADLDLPPLPK